MDEGRAKHVRAADLEALDIRVARAGGSVRYLEGAKHGLRTSVYQSRVPPGIGPRRHTHPYAEFFVLHAGQARFFAADDAFDAEAGDVVIVPPDVVHWFVNTGDDFLQHTAIHEAPVHGVAYLDEDPHTV